MLPSYTEEEDPNDTWGNHEEVSEEITQSSAELRQMANGSYERRDLDSALPLYSLAIDALMTEQERGDIDMDQGLELMIVFLCNRSVCLYRMEMYGDARNDAQEALRISQGKSAKAAFRLAKTQLALKEHMDAIATLTDAIAIINQNTAANDHADDNVKNELQKLLQTAHAHHLASKYIPHATSLSKITSLITTSTNDQTHQQQQQQQQHKHSIREFDIIQELGEGNYSRVVAVRHKVTGEKFALKIMEKKKVESLAKRQHPNVHNEIEMEKRILGLRLNENGDKDKDGKGRHRIVNLYHTFQDYNQLYYLMGFDMDGWDMWSTLRYQDKMVGE